MERRSLLKTLSAAAAAGAAVSLGQGRTLSAEAASGVVATMGGGGPLAQARDAARRGMPPLKITNVKVIATAPSSSNWTIVKVETSEPGLYGLGSATHQEIPQAAQAYIETRLKPFVVGKNCDEIEDIWQSAYVQQYFRSGPESNNALSGIDGALWDILGRRLGVPVYQLLGGKVRAAVPLYGHASAMELPDLEDQVRKYIAEGYQCVRVQLGVPGWSGYGVSGAKTSAATQALRPDGVSPSPVFDPGRYLTRTIQMFEYIRSKVGFDIGLVHDVHERPAPNQSIELCKAVEQYRPFYMEDPLSPEDVGWFQIFRQETSAPLAMGELFTNRNEWLPLVPIAGSISFAAINRQWAASTCAARSHTAASFSMCAQLGTARATWTPSVTATTCISIWPPPTSAFRKKPSSTKRCAKYFPARRSSARATCTPTTSRASASTSMKPPRQSIPTSSHSKNAATIACSMERLFDHSGLHTLRQDSVKGRHSEVL
jgi:mannonate dehydratase